jgi:hypothetical protein
VSYPWRFSLVSAANFWFPDLHDPVILVPQTPALRPITIAFVCSQQLFFNQLTSSVRIARYTDKRLSDLASFLRKSLA